MPILCISSSSVKKHALWAVVGGAFCAPSNELWETRSVRFPQLGHGPQAVAADRRPLRMPSTRRSRGGRTCAIPPKSLQPPHASLFPFVADGPFPLGFRREGPPR